MNADTLEGIAEIIREIDGFHFKLQGEVSVYEDDKQVGRLVFNGTTETTFRRLA